MMRQVESGRKSRFLNIPGVILCLALLTACGGGGGDSSSATATSIATTNDSTADTPTPVQDENPEENDPALEPAGPAPAAAPVPSSAFTLFESGQVRPIALSPSGRLLFVVNTPDNRLEIFTVGDDDLQPVGSVPVGLDPVAVAARSDNEAWVVNHLSDSISVVRLDGSGPRVVRTLLVGDEPRDIVFAGTGDSRAFVTAAYRGQNHPDFDISDLRTPGLGRADVWVFDADDSVARGDGEPLAIINLFADAPRALARSPDGSRVYAAAFLSGNRTTRC